MADYLESEVEASLGRFGERVTRVEAHLSDANGPAKAHVDEIHCQLEARLVGLEPVVVTERAASAHQAIRGAAHKLQAALDRTLAKHDPTHRSGRAPEPEPGAD